MYFGEEGRFSVGMKQRRKPKILIADDSEMNRAILSDMLGDEYEIIEAEDGAKAIAKIRRYRADLSLVLLDIIMPNVDGFEVLKVMNQNRWIDEIPVVVISSETAVSTMERAYELGVSDFISRPFDAMVVNRRVINTMMLYSKQKQLVGMVADQIYEKEQRSNLMIDILSHIMGFKNGESAQHILSVRILTEMLLDTLIKKTDKYEFTMTDISDISLASALHDIGKIGIPDEILNKPGKLTAEEFEVIKSHSMIGAEILQNLPIYQDESIVKIGYEICRWHHERYDGNGYPDGLKGDEIPISAQIVAMADVYDALISPRVYKPAFSHDEAIRMIVNGECGVFNPILLECLVDSADTIQEKIKSYVVGSKERKEIHGVVEKMLYHKGITASERTFYLLEQERIKNGFYAALTQDIQFEYTDVPPMLTISQQGAKKLGLDEIIMNPVQNEKVRAIFDVEELRGLIEQVRQSRPDSPATSCECKLVCDEEERWFRISAMAMWSDDEPPRYSGFIGKAIDIHDSHMKMDNLQHMAWHDTLTGLCNHAHTKKMIAKRARANPDSKFALAIIDLDYFKEANDNYGHIFGDKVLIHMATKLRQNIRKNDIAARVGGDEFLVFFEYNSDLKTIVKRIFNSLIGEFEGFKMSVSMGVSHVEGGKMDYERLFHEADQALYTSKQSGRGQFSFYDDSMQEILSQISPIESDNK